MNCLQCASKLPSRTGRGRPRKYCATCRPSVQKEPIPKRRATCVECSESFETHASRAKFCSQRCKDQAARVPCAGCGDPMHLGRGSRPAGEARCRNCIKLERQHGTLTMYKAGACRCDLCRQAHAVDCEPYWGSYRRRARAYGAAYESINKAAVYERDGWMCGICSLPVDSTARFPDPGSPTLDHIVALSLGGGHVWSNVQLAHYYCNNVKGVREGAAC